MHSTTISTLALGGATLDFWVAVAQGHDVLGKAICKPHQEVPGKWSVKPRQPPSTDRFSKSEERAVTLSSCCCADYAEIYPDGNGLPWDTALGHLTVCLTPVPEYHKDWDASGPIIQQNWQAIWQALSAETSDAAEILASDFLLWALRGYALTALGSVVPFDSELHAESLVERWRSQTRVQS